MDIPSWAEDYIGIPFEELGRDKTGMDCWGLCRYIWINHYGIDVPSYVDEYETIDRKDVIENAVSRGIQDEWHEVDEPKESDGIVMAMMGQPIHVGVVLDKEHFIHVFRGIETTIDRFTSPRWENRVSGFYRHESVIDNA